jgi:hypothetical protein
MPGRPNRDRGEKTLGQMGIAVSNAERCENRETLRTAKKDRIARNRAIKKSKEK